MRAPCIWDFRVSHRLVLLVPGAEVASCRAGPAGDAILGWSSQVRARDDRDLVVIMVGRRFSGRSSGVRLAETFLSARCGRRGADQGLPLRPLRRGFPPCHRKRAISSSRGSKRGNGLRWSYSRRRRGSGVCDLVAVQRRADARRGGARHRGGGMVMIGSRSLPCARLPRAQRAARRPG